MVNETVAFESSLEGEKAKTLRSSSKEANAGMFMIVMKNSSSSSSVI